MTERHDDPALMTGSHALDALSDDERALLEDALRTSPELQAENDSLRETALQLAYAVAPIEPPASLKASLLAQIATTPQAAPLADTTVDRTPVAETTSVQEARPEPARHVASIADGPTAGGRASSEARRRWFQRPAVMLTAAAAVAAVFFGGLGVGSIFDPNGSGTGTTQASSGLDRIYAASDFQRTTTKVAGGGSATVVWSNDLGKSAVILDGVEQAPKGKTYELWYIGSEEQGGTIKSAGLVDGAADGVHSAVLKGAMSEGATIGMTVEPEGGSEQPTTSPIMAVPTTTA
ncbi:MULTISPECIES: anti-sigma factor [Curtobacterium]|jgi:anti-sigma-K factor RskA|uniref:anti-sigma factor n=1 Tax=Curtobacterium TaxID=2034 RepID=UPI000DAACD54|nr:MULTISPECIES: anti-sigma factor [Curtobacterium]MBT1632963.1 anti-sigma factor [Curtobacterium flaccumfaciens pv. oortii]MCS5506610.1 anti-sigma factor [Curtobacterium flaccumfaciens pv. flaccumfaciens]MCS5508850.1 anti-sigma factor [Curtobacterium flaccumfaciens pv. flaccumfaciens]MCS5511858.1 anti-sigma factor [Curtobacterium flaccumfaciens pv. betae]MCX2786342.1 anti-sigma factor [Curtobacterium flaccumfaciens pv. flaccumfaciens]